MTSTQLTELQSTFFHFRLGEAELISLFSIATEDIAPSDVSISTRIENIRFSEDSFTDLKAAVQASHLANRNRPWPNITLETQPGATARSVRVDLSTDVAHISVSGSETNWVHGRNARLNEFMLAHGGSQTSRKDEPKVLLLFLAMFAAIAYFWLFRTQDPETAQECITRAKESLENQDLFNWVMAVLIVGSLAGLAILWLKYRASKAVLAATGSVPTGSWWQRLSTSDKIILIGVPIAALAAIGALMSGFSDVFGGK
ncbi:hypothetical protein ACFZDF_01700 [Streptomyces sp. NPDC007910]|uniref:hypothetical protein n=1 Tax=Streptomyces sp. NPDC007910 TaxID=3364790 RepID=UPI0036F167EF